MAEFEGSRNTVTPIYCGKGEEDHVFTDDATVCQCRRKIKLKSVNTLEQDDYFYELKKRLKVGAECYGDKSFDKTEGRLLQEIQEEILDIAGWSYILWAKIERLKAKL